MGSYPDSAAARDRFILDRRGPRPLHDAWRHQGVIVEDEPTGAGHIARTATVFLTGRECPWRCAMCDLWQHTTVADTPRGAIPAQLRAARDELRRQVPSITQIKLYNAGSFFDPRAVPEADYDDVAVQLADVARVIVESHPALVGPRVNRFLDALHRRCTVGAETIQLEVAMGLETAHTQALARLNKRMTVDEFAAAAGQLQARGAALRVFVLISPPFVPAEEQDEWLLRSIDVALACGASMVSMIPSRTGNGAMEAIEVEGEFRAPRLDDIERSIELALTTRSDRGRIVVDLWDLQRFAACSHCFDVRRARLHDINLGQRVGPRPTCPVCRCGGAI